MTDDAIDRYIERIAREEEDDINRKQGEFILAAFDADAKRRAAQDPLLKAVADAHRAQEAEDNQP